MIMEKSMEVIQLLRANNYSRISYSDKQGNNVPWVWTMI